MVFFHWMCIIYRGTGCGLMAQPGTMPTGLLVNLDQMTVLLLCLKKFGMPVPVPTNGIMCVSFKPISAVK